MSTNVNCNPQSSYAMDYSKVWNPTSTGTYPYTPHKNASKLKSYAKKPLKYIVKNPGFLVAMTMMGLTCFMRFYVSAGASPQKINSQTTQWAYNQGAQHVRDSIKIVQAQEQHIKDSIKIANLENRLLELTSKTGKRLPK